MPTNFPTTSTTGTVGQMTDRAARSAEHALDSTQQYANETLDKVKDGVATARDKASDGLSRATAQVKDLTQKSLDRAREMSADVRDRAHQASERTVTYIQDEPLKSVLIAAAAGALMALLVRALSGSRSN